MQQGPDTGIGESFVETSGFFFAKKDRNTTIFFGELLLNFPLPIFVGECGARPTDPFSFELFFGKSVQSRHQTTGRLGDLIFLDGYGQTIGDIDESARHGGFNVRDCSTSWLSVIHARPFSPAAVPTSMSARKKEGWSVGVPPTRDGSTCGQRPSVRCTRSFTDPHRQPASSHFLPAQAGRIQARQQHIPIRAFLFFRI